MLVGTIVTDSDGVETFIPQDSTGFYLAKDAEIMIDVLNRKEQYLSKETFRGENKDDSKTD